MPSRVKVTMTGPLFDGQATEAVHEWLAKTKAELGEQAMAIVKSKAAKMDRSGRGGTGEAAAGVKIAYADAVTVSGGIHEGVYSWPWLEGTSVRNQSTPFHGYHAFRLASRIVAKRARQTAQATLEDYIGRMGGEGA